MKRDVAFVVNVIVVVVVAKLLLLCFVAGAVWFVASHQAVVPPTTPTSPADTGPDSTKARSQRWVIRFNTDGGRDYLNQLRAFGAKLIVPAADNKSVWMYDDLTADPPPRKLMTDSEWNEFSGLIQFSDDTDLSKRQVGEALGVGELPKGFWAFFPKHFERELAEKECAFAGRRPEDIAETRFVCVNLDGTHEFRVLEQTPKK